MSNGRRRDHSALAAGVHPALALVLALWTAFACGSQPAEVRSAASESAGSYGYEAANDPTPPGMPAPVASEAPAPAPPPAFPGAAPSSITKAGTPAPAAGSAPAAATATEEAQNAARAPLLIYTATLTLAVFGTEAALDAVERLALDKRGYLVRRTDRSITIRVPAESFQEALGGVGKLGDELHRDVHAQDVTDEFADLKIRLRNAEVVRQRLEVLLERAGKVEDALAVERELERVTRDIEQIKGRLALLGELLRFSTITVNFEARPVDAVAHDNPLPFEWLQRLGLPHLLRL